MFFFVISLCANAQETVRFNYNYPYPWQYDCNSMIAIDSTYYLVGNIARFTESCGYSLYGYHVSVINKHGIRDTTIIFDKCGEDTYIGLGSSMNYINDTIVVVGDIQTNNQWQLFILKLDYELDTINVDYYMNDTLTKRMVSFSFDWDNNIIFCGQTDSSYNEIANPAPDETYTKSYLYKVSPSGETIWKKSYPITNCSSGCWSYFRKVVSTYDKGYIAIGYFHSVHGRNIVVKVDSLGNQKWVKFYGNPNYNNPNLMDIVETEDSCIVVCGAYTYGETGGGLYPYDGWLIKLDKDGNEKWNRKHRDYVYGSTDWRDTIYSFYYGLVEKPNHDILAICGTRSDDEHNYIGERFRLRCLDSSGNKKWDKVFTSVGNQQGPLWPNSICLTDDGGIAIAGWGEIYYWNEQNQWTSDQRIFLIKTDSLGNDVETTIRPIAAHPIGKFELVCYPNPASGEFWVEAPGEDVLEVFATNGSMVLAVNVAQGLNRVDLCGVKPGMYLVRLREAGVFGKIIIE